MSEDEFWRRTPRQLARMFEAYSRKAEREHNERMSLAWHIAWLSRVDPRKFPKHDALLAGRRKRRPMTPEEQWRVMSAMADHSPTGV